MAYRDVTNDDIGKLIEVRGFDGCDWVPAILEHKFSKVDAKGFGFLAWSVTNGKPDGYTCKWRAARISVKKLPDGFLPVSWREVSDDECIRRGDAAVFYQAGPKVTTFDPVFAHRVHENWFGRLARDLISQHFQTGVIIRPLEITIPNPHF